ncbi:SUMF1/EgtB/PvdO family nonheme iron enzyme [Coraliomargarita algicola]|uniref:SUMF1/EgtB/PvdO family nonheme iron enzyme n=1 Tax=Coraliomargarita algicola TaxID=3092156 RepID=A0ABZ0RI00_9BACT|nr:SUMF1/EgtB/PvdO family nonheme iron enzyme [Coraliomargarita sp. J2-16]WPJ94884.1 SUMF1/EgtB/PvdO family nonheme iron enzyme [Coraliomargarita sp. J2-16]
MENQPNPPESVIAAQKKEQLKNRVLKSGESFGNYRVVKCMCAGLLAHYYHMQHIRDLHDVTVAIFHHRTDGNDKFLKRLEVLQKTVSSFDHEAIPKIRDCNKIDGRICIFLDPVKGQTLSQYFEAHGVPGKQGVGVKAAVRLIAQLLGALGYAHSQGVDHRDLDSDLVYIQEDGSIRLLGLGVKACLGVDLFESIVSASVSPLVSSKTQGRLNSFDVMSPEYRSGVSEDSRVDVYGVGFVGYWLLTGRKAILSKYEPPTAYVEELSPNWNVFFENSLERAQDKRYQSCKVALLGLKGTEKEPQSEGAGFVQRQIDCIPVPRKIVERGELAARIYRLFIIGLIGLTLTAICASFLNVSYTEEVDYSRTVAELAEASESPSLVLSVKPLVARVEFVGYKQRFFASQGALRLNVQPGDYKLRISAPHHIEQVLRVSIAEGKVATERARVELKPAWTNMTIHTEPGASVSVVDARDHEIELGVADETGTFSLKKGIFAGTYHVIVKKDGYQPKVLENQSIEFGTLSEIDAPLLPLPATVNVRSEPAGASITINDVELGKTPLSLPEVIPNDQYLIFARLDGYRPLGRRVEVKPGAEMLIDFGQLVPLSGALRFRVSVSGESPPEPDEMNEELKVIIDDASFSLGDRALSFVPAGERRIRLEHPLYISQEETIEVEDGQVYDLDFILNPRPGVVQLEIPGNLKAEVRLDGHAASLVDGSIQIPANREVEFELRVRNHLTMLRTFQLSPNETFVWEVQPVAIPGPTEGQSWTVPYFHISFAWVPAGQFEMGSPLPEHARLPNEGPQTKVRFTRGFWAGVYEVTQAQYYEITGRNPSQYKSGARPVESVSWEEAQMFCELLTSFEREAERLPEGYVYRLPSEAEWEYAARAGSTTPFHFGSEADATKGQFRGVYPRDRQDGLRAPAGPGTSTVGRYQANAYGLYDVHGNVREWTLDRYNGRLDGDSLIDPHPRTDGARVVVRGGGWEDSAARVRSAVREEISPNVKSDALGFRVVIAPEL